MYDLQLGRFHTQDRFSEKYKRWSPYNYCMDNPIIFIDANGDSTTYVDTQGNTLIENKDKRIDVVVIEDANLEEFESDVKEYNEEGVLDNPETSDKLNEYGYNINDMKDNANTKYPSNSDYDLGFEAGYSQGYEGKKASVFGTIINILVGSEKGEGSNLVIGGYVGKSEGKKDAKEGKMNMFEPKIRRNEPKIRLRSKLKSANTLPENYKSRP
jgi:hypothetical protein